MNTHNQPFQIVADPEIVDDLSALSAICDIADALYYNNPNDEMIWEIFNIAAERVGIRRRLPDEPDFE